MTEQNGNNKPNEAEGLAFPVSGNEKVIEEEGRMRIWVNSDTGMSRGKYAAAAVHAALTAAGVHPGVPVIVLGGQRGHIERMRTVIRDAGRTEVEPGTTTAGTDYVFEKALTPTDSKPVAYGIYGRVTGNLKYVQVMDAHEVEEQSEFYDVVPLFAIPAAHGQTVGGNKREALAINYCPEHGDLLNRPVNGADARSYRCRNAHGIDEIRAGFRHAEEPETAPELFPGTLDALDSLTIRKEEA